uniref:Uncharacterized protein n=1 Tax=Molossus molossus TaxID=27622 RepID=A0A7J8EEQ8_MOLMO|nr:hypothetical protein HJG59_008879 [Molossus molossus]
MQGSPGRSTTVRKRNPHNIWLWKSAEILSTRKRWESTKIPGTLLKANAQNLIHRNLPWEGHSEKTTDIQGETGYCVYRKRARGIAAIISMLPTGTIFFRISTPPKLHQPWGDAIAPPPDCGPTLPGSHPVEESAS